MGWQDDLQALLGNTKDELWQGLYSSDSTPFNELAAGDWGGASTSVPSAAFNFMDLPLSAVKDVAGYALAAPDMAKDALGFQDAGTRATLGRLTNNDMGGRANWEHFIADKPLPVQAALEIGLDPTTYLSLGMAPAAKAGLKGVRAAQGFQDLNKFEKGVVGALDVADFAFNRGPDKIVRGAASRLGSTPLAQGVGKAGYAALDKVVKNPFALSAASQARRSFQQMESAADEKLQAMFGKGVTRNQLAIVPPQNNERAVAPFEAYDVPPFFQEGLTGVSSSVQKKAFDSWVALKQQQMTTDPNIPGITTPGMGEASPWRQSLKRAAEGLREFGDTYPNAGAATPATHGPQDIRSALSNWYRKQQNLGFITPPPGGYADPGDVRVDEENIQHMAEIGAAAMMAYNDEAVERLFPALRRSSEGMSRVNQAITSEYGPGIQPFIPASWEEARGMLERQGISAPSGRFTTPWGWPEGGVPSKRLDAIEARMRKGVITEQQAIAEATGKSFSKGSPELVEQAAGMGAAPIISFQRQQTNPEAREMFDAFTGTMRPTQIDATTGRAAVPEGFTPFLESNANLQDTYLGSFDSNKDLYDSYMQSLFGQMAPEELDVLRKASIESIYDEMVNAASQASGGQGGATTFLTRGPEGRYKGDVHQKIGIFGESPSDIGNSYQDIPESTKDLPYGRISFKSANEEKFIELTGEKLNAGTFRQIVGDPNAKFTGGSEDYVRALEALGESGFRENPVGGALANIYKIVDMYKAGRDIPVGQTIAEDWYTAAAEEALNIVGPGNYEDAMMLIELMAITSSGTDVERNAQNALRSFAEWKFGSDDYIRNRLGLSEDQVQSLLNGTITTGKRKGEAGWTDHHNMFRQGMQYSQKGTTTHAFEVYANKAAQEGWTPVQGGPKTNNFAGSFVFKLWQDAVNAAIPDGSLRAKVQEALDEAATIWTEDRHQSRISNLATSVTPMGAVINRERGIMASHHVPVRGEDMQAAIWYYSKDRQGFRRVARNDDMAVALREAWNNEQDPETIASVREFARREIGPDATEEEITNFAEDIMRQEVQLAMVSRVLKENKKQVEKVLGKGNPLEKFWESQNDVLGIVSRQAQGVRPRKSPANAIISMVNQVEPQLQAIRNGTSEGATYAWDGQNFVEDYAPSGYAVALTSAGRALDTGKPQTGRKAVQKFLSKYANLLDDPTTAGHIRFGFFPMDGPNAASFDLTLIVPDEQTAIDLARKANQVAIYDIANGRNIETGGTGEPVITSAKGVRDAIREVFGDTPNADANSGITNAVQVDEFANDPLSVFSRRVTTPVMEKFQHLSELAARGNSQLAARNQLQTPGGGVLAAGGPSQSAPLDFRAMGQDPLVSTQGNKVLAEKLGDDTVGNKVEKYYTEAQDDIAALLNSGVSWNPAATLDERLEVVRGDDRLERIVKKYAKDGIDPLFASPRDVMLRRIDRENQAAHGVKYERDSLWDLFVSAWGEQALFSPKYHLGNLQGAFLQNAFSGSLGADSPPAFLAAWKITRGGLEGVEREEALRNLKSYQIAKKWGFDELPSYISRGGVRAMTSSNRTSGSAVGELTARLTKSQRLGRAVGKPFEANADLSQALETVIRGSLWGEKLEQEMTQRMGIVEDSINQMAQQQGLSDFEFSVLNNINLPNMQDNSLTPKLLKDHLMDLGFNDGYAERAARNYSEARNQAKNIAKKHVDKYQFSYDRTNLDEAVSKFAPFMYWISRAVGFYGEELLRHPAIALNYYRANQYIDQAQDDPGLSARQKGFLRLMGGPTGFSILMNPEALFGVVKIFGLDDSYQPDGQTETGGVISWLKARGMGLYPWIDGTLNMMGVYGDTFEPDLLGIRHKALIGSAVNFMRSQLGMEPADAPYQQAMGQARWAVSTFVSQFTPDWFSQPVLPKAGGSTTDATFDQIIESRVIANNPGLSNQQLLDIMTDDQHPEFRKAYQQAAGAGLLQQLLNFTAPQSYRVREDSRDVRNAQVSTIYEAAERAGVDPWDFKPSVGDVEFATTYERLTGKQWDPGDYKKASEKNDLSRATPEGKMYVLQEIEYRNLGGERNTQILSRYQDILFGNDPRTAALDPDSRREVANMWADQNGFSDNIDYVHRLQQAYEQTHPEYGSFKGWQDQMRQLSTGLGGNLDEYRRQAMRQNPNAKAYFERMIAGIKEDYPQEQWADQIERQTTNMNAYLAITGQSTGRFDPGPAPFAPGGDVTLATQTPAQPGGNIPDAMYRILNSGAGYGLNTYGTYWNQ